MTYSVLRRQKHLSTRGNFKGCRNRARHKILCPPGSHPLRTNHPQVMGGDIHRAPSYARATGAKDALLRYANAIFKALVSTSMARTQGPTSKHREGSR